MPSIEIRNYKVSTSIQRFSSGTQFERVLELESQELHHGIVYRIVLGFHTNFSGTWSTPVVGYLSGTTTYAPIIVGWLNLSEFQYYYDILRNEKPVHFHYQIREGTSGYLTRIGIGTDKEPLGEGIPDVTPPL